MKHLIHHHIHTLKDSEKNEENSCPELNKSTIKNFCKIAIMASRDNCLEERCSDLRKL